MIFRGGARIGLFNATWPFATLDVSDSALSLKVFSRRYTLKKEEVTRLEYFRGWFSVGVKIVHTGAALDSYAVFWSFAPKKIIAEAKRVGFQTTDEQTA